MFCKNCGAELNDGAKFCGKCGYNFETGRMANGDSIKTNSIKKYGKIVGAILVVLLVVFGIKNIFFNADRTSHTTSEVKSKKVKGKPKDYYYMYTDRMGIHLTSEKKEGIIDNISDDANWEALGEKFSEQDLKYIKEKIESGDVFFKIYTVKVNLDKYNKTMNFEDITFGKGESIANLLEDGLIVPCLSEMVGVISISSDTPPNIIIDDVLNLNSTSFMFAGVSECKKIMNLDNVCMQNVEEAAFMFKDISLESLDVRNFDMSNVKNTMGMFCNCYNLKTLDISNWDMRKNKNMSYMFDYCNNLMDLDVSKWNTSKVTNMEYMFAGCEKMIRFDINNWDTSKVTNMEGMFSGCNSLLSLDVSSWDVSNVENMDYMFNNCHLLEAVDMVKWKTKKLKSAIDIINGSEKLVDFNFSKIKTK